MHISVGLAFDPEKIVSLYVKDQTGAVVGGVHCDTATICSDEEEDKLQSFELQVADGIKSLTPYAHFKTPKRHQTWMGTTFPVPPKHREL